MTSTECSMGLRSFLAHDEPLSAGRLKLSDGRLCEELEIKNLMRSSPLTQSSNHSTNSHPKSATLANGNAISKSAHGYEYGGYFFGFSKLLVIEEQGCVVFLI